MCGLLLFLELYEAAFRTCIYFYDGTIFLLESMKEGMLKVC
jgi:hypothetical protein